VGAPAALTGDDLEALAFWANRDRLQQALRQDRGRQLAQGGLVEMLARLIGVRIDRGDR
jgi:hypothetical protein